MNILFCRIIEEARAHNPDLPSLDISAFGPPANLYATNKSDVGAGGKEATTMVAHSLPAGPDKPLKRSFKRETLSFTFLQCPENRTQVSIPRRYS